MLARGVSAAVIVSIMDVKTEGPAPEGGQVADKRKEMTATPRKVGGNAGVSDARIGSVPPEKNLILWDRPNGRPSLGDSESPPGDAAG